MTYPGNNIEPQLMYWCSFSRLRVELLHSQPNILTKFYRQIFLVLIEVMSIKEKEKIRKNETKIKILSNINCSSQYSKYKLHINTTMVLPGCKARTYQVIIWVLNNLKVIIWSIQNIHLFTLLKKYKIEKCFKDKNSV